MTTDDDTPPAKPVGPHGEPLLGLETRHSQTPKRGYRPSPRERPTEVKHRQQRHHVDPLDTAAQNALGTKPSKVRLDEPLPAEAYDNQIFWCIVGRIDGGPWSHLVAAENMRAATFPSRRRAEATVMWMKRQAEVDGNGCEYRIVPVMRGEKQI
jgi:hypothetical protein